MKHVNLIAVVGILILPLLACCTSRGSVGVEPASGESQVRVADRVTPVAHDQSVLSEDLSRRTQDEFNTMQIFERAAPATVFVTQNRVVTDWRFSRQREVPTGSGSGFIWDKKGHIVTNYHVVDGSQKLYVTLYNQKTYEAKIVGGERNKDIAVLKIDVPDKKELTPIILPQKGYELFVGQKAIAIGNPFGLDHSLTQGIISAIGRDRQGYGGVTIKDMVQTDASINPGNSGGPLLDSQAQLIGMNTMIFSRTGVSSGVGFAVPVDTITRVVNQIIRYGYVKQVGLGITLLPDNFSRRYGIKGVVVQAVAPKSPAAKAGIVGLRNTVRGIVIEDVIVAIDDQAIINYNDLYTQLDGHEEGDIVRVKLVNNREEREVEVKLYLLNRHP